MPINILVNGAFGRMGQMTVKTISEHPEFNLVGQTGRDYDLKKSIRDSKAQVVIDFTTPEAVFNNCQMIIEAGAHPVIGTSGLTSPQLETLSKQCAELKLGAMVVPNFSLGAVLMMKYAKQIARYLPHVEIIEMHHETKADSPSATALRTAELLAEAQPQINSSNQTSREVVPGARGAKHYRIPIHAIRLPGLLAHQQIIFGNEGETLSLRHDSIDRQCFMPGLSLACKKVMELDHLVIGLDEIL